MARRPHGWGKALLASLTPEKRAQLLGECAESAPEVKPAAPVTRMNKGEKKYAQLLECRRRTGSIKSWEFEGTTLRLAYRCHFRPDFAVTLPDDTVEYHEVKGRKGKRYWCREDAKIKLKVAASLYPNPFFVVWPSIDGTWSMERIRR